MASLTVWVQCAAVSPCLLHGHRKSGWLLCIVPASSPERTPPCHRGERMTRQTSHPWSPGWGEFHVGSLSFRREAGHRMWKEALPTLSPLGLEQTYPKSQGCSALCVLVPTAPSVLHSLFLNGFNKQGSACFPGYRRREQCGALVEPMQARYPQLPLPLPKAQRP